MKLKELYEQRVKEYEQYSKDKIAYDTRMEEYNRRLKEMEVKIREKSDKLPDNIKLMVINVLEQCDGDVTSENMIERLNLWRNLYTELEKIGMQMLGD